MYAPSIVICIHKRDGSTAPTQMSVMQIMKGTKEAYSFCSTEGTQTCRFPINLNGEYLTVVCKLIHHDILVTLPIAVLQIDAI